MGYHVAQRVMQGEHKPSWNGVQRSTPLRAGLLLMLSCCILLGIMSRADAQSVPPGFKVGKVTAMRHHEIQVNLRNYPLRKKVEVRDDAGKLKDLRDISKGSLVMFHLARGGVDQIILILPR